MFDHRFQRFSDRADLNLVCKIVRVSGEWTNGEFYVNFRNSGWGRRNWRWWKLWVGQRFEADAARGLS